MIRTLIVRGEIGMAFFRYLILMVIWPLFFYCYPSFANELLWERSGGNNRSHQYSSLSQINEKNIKNLEVAWVYKSGYIDRAQTVQTNPIIANNLLITSNLDGFVIAINSINGKEVWRKKLPSPVARRGLTFHDNSVFVPTSNGIYILNVENGNVNKKIGDSLTYLPPIVTNNKIFVANLNSTVQAYSISGDLIWTLSLAKDNVYPRIWSGISFDPDSKLIFINTSNANGLIGGDIKNGGYSCSVIAINSFSGKVAWSFQEVLHDVWDLDIVGPPVVTKIINNGKPRAVVVSVSKSGNVILLDKYNGKPIFGIEKYSTPPSIIKSEELSSYQIKLSKPENFSDIYFDLERDITNLSQHQKNYVEHKLRNAKSGRFLSVNPNFDVVMFGLHGGAEWPGMSVDEDSGIIVVPSNKYPWILRTSYFDKDESKTKHFVGKNSTYTSKCVFCHGPALAGAFQNEYEGDLYFPSLIGITQKRSYEYLTSIEKFRFNHKYAASDVKRYQEQGTLNRFFLSVDSNLLNKLLAKIEKVTGGGILKSHRDYKYLKQTIDDISEADLKNLFMLFKEIDNNIIENNRLSMTAN